METSKTRGFKLCIGHKVRKIEGVEQMSLTVELSKLKYDRYLKEHEGHEIVTDIHKQLTRLSCKTCCTILIEIVREVN